ncbi:hypothetical protein OKW41_006476 [Paraburkholderia sp. UCT70]
MSGNELGKGMKTNASEMPNRKAIIRAGVAGGLAGALIIWIFEAPVWVGAQHLMSLAGIPRNATALVFGKEVQESIGIWA